MTDFPMVELPVEGMRYVITTDLLDEPIEAIFESGRFVVGLRLCTNNWPYSKDYELCVPQDMASVVGRST